jgi:thiamine-monophosphate kinase
MAVEDVHFRREWSSLWEIGAKVTAANIADIYAMGGDPQYLLVTAALPQGFSVEEISQLAQGIRDEAALAGAIVIGGDLSSAEKLVISITAVGEVDHIVARSGAQVGDSIILSGITGLSAAGLELLRSGRSDPKLFIEWHKNPILDSALAEPFTLCATAMCDVSDGLLSELNHLAQSSGVAMAIDRPLIAAAPGFSELQELATQLGSDIWEWVLSGGEDHRLLATTSGAIPNGAIVIGHVRAGAGVWVDGSIVEARGYRHF